MNNVDQVGHYNFGINYVNIQGCLENQNFKFQKYMNLKHIFEIVNYLK
jgi:uncharacterized protein YfkK (UPF0435 family)